MTHPRPSRRARRSGLALGLLALGVVVVAPAPATSASPAAPPANGNFIITDASTTSYPGGSDPVVVCIDGASAHVMDVGDQYSVEQPVGDAEITVFDNDAATCTDPPDRSVTISLNADDLIGVVIGWDTLSTFTYDESCMEAGTGRTLVANGADLSTVASLDVYAWSTTTGDRIALATALAPGANVYTPSVPAGDGYLIQAFSPGADPNGPPLAELGTVDIPEGTQVEIMIAGGDGQRQSLGAFTFEQGPDVCAAEEPPPESEPSTTSTTTTQVRPTDTGDAVPATPVSGNASFTG